MHTFSVLAGKPDGDELNIKYASEFFATFDEAIANAMSVWDYPIILISIGTESGSHYRIDAKSVEYFPARKVIHTKPLFVILESTSKGYNIQRHSLPNFNRKDTENHLEMLQKIRPENKFAILEETQEDFAHAN
ncbi:hypothetical protein [Methylotenera sp.]|uniref:hypothetical protein n=1 Tax=Methylotenera sp. TaxID=2051956 RepID=UPI00248A7968|nr:hypothetical protein [Methylotenera sp.]MDI1362530.1 hypothetical protein [Methylotenera sp.]